MKLFNIGAEGQLYFGAIGAAGVALLLAGQSTPVLIMAMIIGGAVLGAAWGAIPGLLRAFLRTNEIITSLMLNYVAALVLNYLIFDSLSYWRDTSPTGVDLPPGQGARRCRELAGDHDRVGGGPVRLLVAVRSRWRLGALHPDAVRLRGQVIATRRGPRGTQGCARDARSWRSCASRERSRDRRCEPDGTSDTCSMPAACSRPITLHGHRRRGACPLQSVRCRVRRVPARRPPERRYTLQSAEFPSGSSVSCRG